MPASSTTFVVSLAGDTILPLVTDIVLQVHSVDPPHPLIMRSIELTARAGWRQPAPRRPPPAAADA